MEVVRGRAGEGLVEEAVVVFALEAFANYADVFCAGDGEDFAASLG